MTRSTVDSQKVASTDVDRLRGLPFDDSDEVIRAAINEASVPSLLMSMVHMTGDLGILDELPKPYMLIAMDQQGGMSEPDKETVRARAFDVVRDYRDRGCPPPFVPDSRQLRRMIDVVSAGAVTDDFLDYISADLRFSDADRNGPVLASTPEQRSEFPVVVIGCGEAGLLAGIKLKEAGIPFTIIEKRSGPGGTWLANRYPGCRVDISNHYYSYSFEPNDHWTHHFCQQPEILQYLNGVFERYQMGPHARFDTAVDDATWDETDSVWRIQIRAADGTRETLTARGLICAVGQFSNAVIPEIKGANTFAGPMFHTANWDDTVDLTGKRVAVIGAGASGFQLVPAIAPITEHVDVYQRTPQWMAPNVLYHDAVGDGARWALRHLPYYGRWLRFVTWWPLADGAADAATIDPTWENGGLSASEANHMVREIFIAWMRVFCSDEKLLEQVTPAYPPLAKRTLQDNGTWLTTLQRDDVQLVRDGIAEITPDGITTVDGTHREADVVLWATGFDVNHQLGPINVKGYDGRDLNTAWGDTGYAYLGVTVDGFPNFYCMYGPGTNAVNGVSIIYNSECQMRYIMGCLDMVIARDAGSAAPRKEVVEEYHQRNAENLKHFVYTHPAVTSYYKTGAGAVPTLYGGRILDYWTWTSQANPDDYEFRV